MLLAGNDGSPCLTGKRKSLMVTEIHPQVDRGAALMENPKSQQLVETKIWQQSANQIFQDR
jgi:hypothetical protein